MAVWFSFLNTRSSLAWLNKFCKHTVFCKTLEGGGRVFNCHSFRRLLWKMLYNECTFHLKLSGASKNKGGIHQGESSTLSLTNFQWKTKLDQISIRGEFVESLPKVPISNLLQLKIDKCKKTGINYQTFTIQQIRNIILFK